MIKLFKIYFLIFFLNADFNEGRNHKISIKNDRRHAILLSHFGYNPSACIHMTIDKFEVPKEEGFQSGFSLDLSSTSGVSSYVESGVHKCFLEDQKIPSMVLQYNNIKHTFTMKTFGSNMAGLLIYKGLDFSPGTNSTQLGTFNMTAQLQTNLQNNLLRLYQDFISKDNATRLANSTIQPFINSPLITQTQQRALLNILGLSNFSNIKSNPNVISNLKMILLTAKKVLGDDFAKSMEDIFHKLQEPVIFPVTFPLKLLIEFPSSNEEGDYDVYFHNCAYGKLPTKPANISMTLIEKNWNSYLSAGNQPLPLLFFIMCSAYVLLIIIWSLTLFTSEHMVFKIHYLMLTLLIMKSLTLFFHGINYYELGRKGVPEQGWAVMYYITHLLKGALLFTTIILIGAGWAFIRHMLGGKVKKIFIIIIPLQILANVAAIIIDESEESAVRYLTWRNIFLLVDLICCGAILFPVIWSIKHLKEAANIDGKQAQNLEKLKLFRHFYILIICYIYFTRIIVYLLVITVSFKLSWTVDLFRELSTIFFMVITGYKFRPTNNNPYLLVPLDDDSVTEEEQMEHAWSQSGVTEGVTKINQLSKLDSDQDEDDTVYDKTLQAPLIINNDNGAVHTSRL